MSAKPYEEMTSLHEDSTYILGDLIMEGSLDGGDHPVVIDGQFKGDVIATLVPLDLMKMQRQLFHT